MIQIVRGLLFFKLVPSNCCQNPTCISIKYYYNTNYIFLTHSVMLIITKISFGEKHWWYYPLAWRNRSEKVAILIHELHKTTGFCLMCLFPFTECKPEYAWKSLYDCKQEYAWKSLHAMHKIYRKTSFFWPAFSRIRTETQILSLYMKKAGQRKPLF